MKSIGVCIVSYGYGHLVGHCIDSILSQTRKPDQLLVVDDGKHDGVKAVADMFGVECIERPENLGVIDNFNDILFNRMETERYMLVGADNWLRPDCIEKIININADIVSFDMAVTGSAVMKSKFPNRCERVDGYYIRRFPQYSEDRKIKMIFRKNFIIGSSLWDTEKARKVGGYQKMEGLRRPCEDWCLARKMFRAGCSHVHISEPLLYYRRHLENFNGIY